MIRVRSGHAHLSDQRRFRPRGYVSQSSSRRSTLLAMYVRGDTSMEERLEPSFKKPTTELFDTTMTRLDSPADTSPRLYSYGTHPDGRGGKATLRDGGSDPGSSEAAKSVATEALQSEPRTDICQPNSEHRNGLASMANTETRTAIGHTPQKQNMQHEDVLQQEVHDKVKSISVMEDSAQAYATNTVIDNRLTAHYRRLNSHQTNLVITPFISSHTSPIVTLVVGGSQSPARESNPVSFFVHKQVLVKYSKFFSAAFGDGEDEATPQAGWIEKQSLAMHLPEDRVEDIGWLIKWLYWWDAAGKEEPENKDHTDCLRICTQASALWHPATDGAIGDYVAYQARHRQSTTSPHTDHDDAERPDPPPFGPLIRLYIIADKYGVTTDTEALKTLICRRAQTMAHTAHCTPTTDDVTHLWTNVIHKTPIEAMRSSISRSEPPSQTLNPTPSPPTNLLPSSPSSSARPSSPSCLKQTFLSLFTSLSPTAQYDLFASKQEKWHAGFLRDLVVKMVHVRIVDAEIEREEARKKERGGERERHDRMRAAKVRIMG